MKAKLEFNLDDVDDRKAHLRCVKSTDMAAAIFEIVNNVVRQTTVELGNSEADLDWEDGVERLYANIYNVLQDNGVDNISELIE